MAGELPSVTARQLLRALERDGWYIARTTGRHQMRHPSKPGTIPVSNDLSKPVKEGTLRSILQAAGMTPERFRELL